MTTVEAAPLSRSGDWVQDAPGLQQIDYGRLKMKIDADRYLSPEFAALEREAIWSKVWQVACRVEDVPNPGDWKEYKILDQSYLVVRGQDGVIRGLVNACRHRGNVMCVEGKGNTGRRFTCPYHLWSYDLEGKLRGVSHPELVGDIDKDELGLLEVSVDTFAGFVFLNPDPEAAPLADFLGETVLACMEPYHLDEMVAVLDVTESIDCNWKIVVDAFQEGYHIQGIHPELLKVIVIDPYSSRFNLGTDHVVSCAPFKVPAGDPEGELEGLLDLPTTFPTVAGYLPRLQELVDEHRDADGQIQYPDGVTGRTLLQQATRETLTGLGCDVSGLTDEQMTDNHGWLLFPNFFMTIRAGEATIITMVPHTDGDPNRCIWQIRSYIWLPEEHHEAFRTTPVVVDEPGSYAYARALQQDYDQMPRQQRGLRSLKGHDMHLAMEEMNVARFHTVLDRWLELDKEN